MYFADFNYFGLRSRVTLMPFSSILAQPTILYTCLSTLLNAPAKTMIAAVARDSVAVVSRRSVACHPTAFLFPGRSSTLASVDAASIPLCRLNMAHERILSCGSTLLRSGRWVKCERFEAAPELA